MEELTTPRGPLIRKTRWAWALGTFFGAGYLRPGPGTFYRAEITESHDYDVVARLIE